MAERRVKIKNLGEAFRLDAKAEGETAAIGDWRCQEGRPTREAQGFACSPDRRNAAWAFSRSKAFKTMASLELLGTLVSVRCVAGGGGPVCIDRLSISPGGTDNQGNSYLLDKLMTTKFPLGVILMELSCQLGLRRACLHARWIPRLQNEEADALTNGEFGHFDPAKRIPVDLDDLGFRVLNELFEEGEAYIADLERLKKEEKAKKARKVTTDAVRRTAARGPRKLPRR